LPLKLKCLGCMLRAWFNSLDSLVDDEVRGYAIAREMIRLLRTLDWNRISVYDLWSFMQKFSRKYIGSDFLVKLIDFDGLRELNRALNIIRDIISKLNGYEKFKASVKAAIVSTNFSLQSIYSSAHKHPFALTVGEVLSEYANVKIRANVLRQLYRDIDGARILYLSGSVLELMFDKHLIDEISRHCRRLVIVPTLPLTKEFSRKIMNEVSWIEREVRSMSEKSYMVFNISDMSMINNMIIDSDLIIVKNPMYYFYTKNYQAYKVFYLVMKASCKAIVDELTLPAIDKYILLRLGAKRVTRKESIATEVYTVISHVLPVHRIAQLLES